MHSIDNAGKLNRRDDALAVAINWGAFLGFLSLDLVAKAVHLVLCPLLIAISFCQSVCFRPSVRGRALRHSLRPGFRRYHR
jgi:hypothetical protein